MFNSVSSNHFTLRQTLTMPVYFAQIGQTVDHQTKRLFKALGRQIGRPMDLLNSGSIAQMKACHRIDWAVAAEFFAQIVRSTGYQPLAQNRVF
jgi:hypothetical protein